MNYKFSPEEQIFQQNELPSGYKIIEEEKMMGVKTTCIDSRVIVLVGDSIGFFSSLLLLILSLLFKPTSVLLPSSPSQLYLGLNLASKVCGVIGHSLGHLSAVGTDDRLIFSSILFNLLEVSFSSTKISFLTAENPDEYVDLTAIVTGIAFDIMMMVFRLILFIDLNRKRMEKRHNNQSKK